MKNICFVILMAFFLLAFLTSAECASVKDQDQKIRIGVIDAFSGPASPFSTDIHNGFMLAINEANESVVLKYKLEVLTRDDEAKASKSIRWAKELVERENVHVLTGLISTASVLGLADYLQEVKVPLLVTGALGEAITGEKGHRYVFGIPPNTAMLGRATARYFGERTFTKYALAGSDYEFGHNLLNVIWEQLTKIKSDVQKVAEIYWPPFEPDLIPYLTMARGRNPEVILTAGAGAENVNLLKSVKTMGLQEEIAVFGPYWTDHSALYPLGEDAPEGVLGTAPFHHYYPDTPEVKAFSDNFYKAYDRFPSGNSFVGYVCGLLITEAFSQTGTLDIEEFINTLAGLKIATPVGPIYAREYDHQVVMPLFFGKTAKNPDYPFLIANEIVKLPGEELIPSVEEIRKKREQGSR